MTLWDWWTQFNKDQEVIRDANMPKYGPYYYGWKRSLPDHRDFKLAPAVSLDSLPRKTNNRALVNWVYDQKNESSCTGNACADLAKYLWLKDLNKVVWPSRNFIYYCERDLENDVADDNGAELRDGLQVLSNIGFCSEQSWDYNNRTLYAKPPLSCYNLAAQSKIKSYAAPDQTELGTKSCLAAGYPFVFGFNVYESFESKDVARTGRVPMPKTTENSVGGHAVCAVDYDDDEKCFLVLNSWGPNWGDKGYFHFPYDYMLNTDLSDDLYTGSVK